VLLFVSVAYAARNHIIKSNFLAIPNILWLGTCTIIIVNLCIFLGEFVVIKNKKKLKLIIKRVKTDHENIKVQKVYNSRATPN